MSENNSHGIRIGISVFIKDNFLPKLYYLFVKLCEDGIYIHICIFVIWIYLEYSNIFIYIYIYKIYITLYICKT